MPAPLLSAALLAALLMLAWFAPRLFAALDDRLDRAERERLVGEAMASPLDCQRVEPWVAQRRERHARLLADARRREDAVADLVARRARHFDWLRRKDRLQGDHA